MTQSMTVLNSMREQIYFFLCVIAKITGMLRCFFILSLSIVKSLHDSTRLPTFNVLLLFSVASYADMSVYTGFGDLFSAMKSDSQRP